MKSKGERFIFLLIPLDHIELASVMKIEIDRSSVVHRNILKKDFKRNYNSFITFDVLGEGKSANSFIFASLGSIRWSMVYLSLSLSLFHLFLIFFFFNFSFPFVLITN